MSATVIKRPHIDSVKGTSQAQVGIEYPKMTDAEKAQALLAAVVDSSEDAIISKTLEGKILSWNSAAERLFGYTADEAIGQSITILIPPDRQHEESMIIQRLRRGERIKHYETVRLTKDGRLINISLSISPIRSSTGVIVGASKIARDITERKLLQAERHKTGIALQEADRRKDEFLAMLAHELRNPLAPIANAILVLKRHDVSDAVREEALDLMGRQVRHMTRLIDDLMDIARVSQGKIVLQKQSITLAEVIQTAVETTQPLITKKQHEISITQPDEPIWLEADPVRLSQAFANLLNNAAKYTNENGQITLTAKKEGADAIIAIRDNGIGIPADMLPSIFNLFVQVDQSLERTQGGLGIGLTLVKELVELHGGHIRADSEGAGRGSTFTVRLPVASGKLTGPQVLEHVPQDPEHVESTRHYRVLIVDDSLASAKTLGWTLELFGHQVALAHDVHTALEMANSFKPEVVLLDIGLPGTNGYEICRLLRQNPNTKDAFIIAQTGWGQEEHRRRSKEVGFDDHLVKPIELDMLNDFLATLGNKRSE